MHCGQAGKPHVCLLGQMGTGILLIHICDCYSVVLAGHLSQSLSLQHSSTLQIMFRPDASVSDALGSF